MAQLQIDLSASKGLYRKIDGANYYSENNNNLIYDAENGQVVSGVYNPFRMPGYISPAVDAWVNVSFDMPSWSGADPSRGIITGIQEGDTYIISTTDFQIKPVAISISQFAVTGFTLLTNLSQPGNTHSMIVGELNGVSTIYHVSGSKVHSTASSTALVTGLKANNWQSSVVSNPKGLNSLYENNRTGFVDGKNRLMYVYDKYAIHAIDGSDVVPASGIFNADILRFPTNYLITGGVEFRGKIS